MAPTTNTLFSFDDPTLALLPMAARRALDLAGLRLSLEPWQALPLATREALTNAGASETVDLELVRKLSKAPDFPRVPDPDATTPPATVVATFGPSRPITADAWCALRPLERYVLVKVVAKPREDRLDAAWHEIIERARPAAAP